VSVATSLFALAEDLAKAHERSAPGRVTVVPLLVDDLTKALPVLHALCAVTEGRLLDTSDHQLQTPIPGTRHVVRRSAVTAALTTAPLGTRHIDLVDVEGDLLDAVFVDPPAGPAPSPGEQTVLAIARAAAHRELDEHEFAVITYRDTLIDLSFRRPVWNLAVKQLRDLPHQVLRTLVVVAESTIDIDLHCQAGLGFRLAVDSGRLLRRRGPDDLSMAVASIARHPRPFVLFLGAGFAASSRLPMGNALRDSAIRRRLNIPESDPYTSEQLAIRFHNWISEREGWLSATEQHMRQDEYVRQLTLEQVMRAEKRFDPDLPTLADFRMHHDAVVGAPGSAPLDLAAILERSEGRIILAEVNFDRLIETHSPVPLKVFSSDEDFSEAADYLGRYLTGAETEVPLLKFHGSIEQPDSCIVSAEQTEVGVSNGKLAALRALLDASHPRIWIYVGVSMRDKDLLRVFGGNDFVRGTEELWVSPYLPDTVEEYGLNQQPLWRDRELRSIEDRLISETADTFFAALRAAWLGSS
jgi:hypothetical protein